jgi:hypothetical protein
VEKSSPEMCATSAISKPLPKVNNRPFYTKVNNHPFSPNLVTLLACLLFSNFSSFPSFFPRHNFFPAGLKFRQV